MHGCIPHLAVFFSILFGIAAGADAQDARAFVPKNAPRLLLLTSGELIDGGISVGQGGYQVSSESGNRFIESARVSLTAETRTDAWQQLRKSFSRLTPEIHMQLAHWCLRYELRDEAEREVLDALRLDPWRQEARTLLSELTSNRRTPPDKSSAPEQLQMLPQGGSIPAPSRSLGGLPRSLAVTFVRHVQPLVSSKCATVGCHGLRSESAFQLTPVSRGSTPLIAERNLAAVLKQLNPGDPLQSPLLQRGSLLHGGMTQPVFTGRTGQRQQSLLQDWLTDVAADSRSQAAPESDALVRTAVATETTGRNTVTAGGIRQASATATAAAQLDRPDRQTSLLTNAADAERDRQLIQEALADSADDPFHPDIFNRRYHGANARQLSRPLPDPESAAGAGPLLPQQINRPVPADFPADSP